MLKLLNQIKSNEHYQPLDDYNPPVLFKDNKGMQAR
jgi:hypothetical protein